MELQTFHPPPTPLWETNEEHVKYSWREKNAISERARNFYDRPAKSWNKYDTQVLTLWPYGRTISLFRDELSLSLSLSVFLHYACFFPLNWRSRGNLQVSAQPLDNYRVKMHGMNCKGWRMKGARSCFIAGYSNFIILDGVDHCLAVTFINDASCFVISHRSPNVGIFESFVALIRRCLDDFHSFADGTFDL